jgi:hypothetical protein
MWGPMHLRLSKGQSLKYFIAKGLGNLWSLCARLEFYIWLKTKTLGYTTLGQCGLGCKTGWHGALNIMTLSYLGFQGVVARL